MDRIPGLLLALVSFCEGFGISALAFYVSSFDVRFAVAAFLPVLMHWILFLHGFALETEKLFDLTGQIAFMVMIMYVMQFCTMQSRHVLLFFLISIWSIRLGVFLFLRFLERKRDFRFVKARNKPGYFFFAWTNQGVWCSLQGAGYICVFLTPIQSALTSLDVFAACCFIISLLIETVADLQKLEFVRRFSERPKRGFINKGLWKYSRHPNFAGESMCHFSLFLLSLNGFSEWSHVSIGFSSALFSPLFLMQTSLPWLEFEADKRFGKLKAYQDYKHRTSAFWLMPVKKTN